MAFIAVEGGVSFDSFPWLQRKQVGVGRFSGKEEKERQQKKENPDAARHLVFERAKTFSPAVANGLSMHLLSECLLNVPRASLTTHNNLEANHAQFALKEQMKPKRAIL